MVCQIPLKPCEDFLQRSDAQRKINPHGHYENQHNHRLPLHPPCRKDVCQGISKQQAHDGRNHCNAETVAERPQRIRVGKKSRQILDGKLPLSIRKRIVKQHDQRRNNKKRQKKRIWNSQISSGKCTFLHVSASYFFTVNIILSTGISKPTWSSIFHRYSSFTTKSCSKSVCIT